MIQVSANGRVLSVTNTTILASTADATQNLSIQAAFNQANSAATKANTDNTVIIATTSSSNGTYVPVIQVSANGRVLSVTNTTIDTTYTTAAYTQANTGAGLAQGAFNQANSAAQYANTDNTVIVATTSSSNGTYIPVIQVAANGRVLSVTNTAITGGGSSSGYLANSVIFANSTGYLSNTANLIFDSSNNALDVNGSIILSNTRTSNSASIVYNAALNSIDFIFN